MDDTQDIEELLRLSHSYIILGKRVDYLDDGVDSETRRLTDVLQGHTGDMVFAFLQLRGVLENIEISIAMLGRYPWHGTKINKTKHLELTWFLFQNLCYVFHEKVKHFSQVQKSACKQLALPDPNWLKEELKFIKKTMSEPIRDRGNTTHSWNARNNTIHRFSMVEFLALHEKEKYTENLSGHYSDAKYELRYGAKIIFENALECYLRILNSHFPKPMEIVQTFNDLVDAINKKRVTLTRAAL